MALDDNGNEQIDFVWGNMPHQPNHDYDEDFTIRQDWSNYPGDGEAEYYFKGHDGGVVPSLVLEGKDNHVISMRAWNDFPHHIGDGETGYTLKVDWWELTDAMEFPNLPGNTVEDALQQLREMGVAENFLSDALTDAENPYDAGTVQLNSGVVIWHYLPPMTQIGTHWDGSPWYAYESEGIVEYCNSYPADLTALGSYDEGSNTTSDPELITDWPYWLSFSVIQTTDPDKNSWSWWN